MKYKFKTIIVGIASSFVILTSLVFFNEVANGRIDICFKDSLTCNLEKIEWLKSERNKATDANNAMVAKINEDTLSINKLYDEKIESIKALLPAGYVSDLIKSEDFENVPKTILEKLVSVPQAKADSVTSSDISLSSKPVISKVKTQVKILDSYSPSRYSSVLKQLKSPYADVPIAQYCEEAGLPLLKCDIMVGIAQQESQSGKDFHCVQQTLAYSIKLGQTYYHNPMGLSDVNVHYKNYATTGKKNADFQGCFIRKFDSWDSFWKFMPQSFMDKNMRYYIENWNYVSELSGIWKNGSKNKPDEDWTRTVNGIVTKIKKANLS
jgi:hypothetical protein